MQLSSSRKPVAFLGALAVAVLVFFSPTSARAEGDGAGIGVARISLIHGDVAVQRGDSPTAVAAAINAPVLGADYVSTGDDSRAEVQFDGNAMVRLSSNVQLRFTHLDQDARALQLAQGTIEFRVLHGTGGRTTIDTPSVTIRPRQSGSYRLTVTGDGTTQITVRSGEAQIVLPDGERIASAGNTIVASGTAASPVLQSVDAIAYDDFDRFNKDRDERHERALAASSSYVNADVNGVEDLDAYGRWVSDGTYGHVWVPQNVASDWAPYRDGRWVWEDRYGWTWVADEPWGWAPYHYGRWYRSAAYGWCWYPPAPLVAPVWQPGLVAFFGFGGGNVAFGFGSIGWLPLAPFEPYYPWYGGFNNRTFVNNTTVVNNITNVTNVTNVYNNGNSNGLLTRMYQNASYGASGQTGKRFLLGKFDHPLRVAPAQLAQAQIVKGVVPAVPTAHNLRFTDTPVAAALAVSPTLQQRVFAGNAVVVHRVPFEEQRAALVTTLARARAQAIPRAATAPAAPSGAATTVGRAGTSAVPPTARAPVSVITGTTTSTVRAASDPWARFSERRGVAPPTHVTAPTTTSTSAGGTVGTPSATAKKTAPTVTYGDSPRTAAGSGATAKKPIGPDTPRLHTRVDADALARPVSTHASGPRESGAMHGSAARATERRTSEPSPERHASGAAQAASSAERRAERTSAPRASQRPPGP